MPAQGSHGGALPAGFSGKRSDALLRPQRCVPGRRAGGRPIRVTPLGGCAEVAADEAGEQVYGEHHQEDGDDQGGEFFVAEEFE